MQPTVISPIPPEPGSPLFPLSAFARFPGAFGRAVPQVSTSLRQKERGRIGYGPLLGLCLRRTGG